jgi:hypothetical protein
MAVIMNRRLILGILLIILAVALTLPFAKSSAVYAATETFYTSSSAAYLVNEDATYSTAVEAATADTLSSSSIILNIGQTWAGSYYAVKRSVVYFDTSSIPDDATITSATLNIYGVNDTSWTDFDITIQEGMPTYPHDPAVVGDYNYMYYTGNGGSLSTSSFSTVSYNTITLSSTGLTWINKTGTTKLMLRSSRDISGTTPTGSENITVYSYDQGSGYRPYLEVTYISAPDITTNAASNIAGTTARLNATVVDDGGEACEVRWGWDDDPHPTPADGTNDYEFHTDFAGSYTTGQKPYYDISDLNTSDDYYFRVEIQNSEDTELGAELSFTTSSGVGDPSGFVAYPSATSVSLVWTKGTGATNSIVRYRNDTYPTSETDGTLVYQGVSASYTHEGLTRGTTYYYAVWGESGGVYSDNSADVMVTTSAAETGGDDIDAPSTPLRWLTGTDYTNLSNLPIVYDTGNAIADSLSIPRATVWLLAFVGFGILFAFVVYVVSQGQIIPALIALEVFYAFGYAVKQMPLVIPALLAIILGAIFFVRRREAV